MQQRWKKNIYISKNFRYSKQRSPESEVRSVFCNLFCSLNTIAFKCQIRVIQSVASGSVKKKKKKKKKRIERVANRRSAMDCTGYREARGQTRGGWAMGWQPGEPKGLTRALKIENSKWPIFPADGTETKSRQPFIMTCIAVRAAVICTVSLQNVFPRADW